MNLEIRIKNVGVRYGTVGWLKSQLESGELLLEESNNFYLPGGGCRIHTHGLIIRDKTSENSALLAYRNVDGRYRESVANALGDDARVSHWPMNLTAAAVDALEDICIAWISTQEDGSDDV